MAAHDPAVRAAVAAQGGRAKHQAHRPAVAARQALVAACAARGLRAGAIAAELHIPRRTAAWDLAELGMAPQTPVKAAPETIFENLSDSSLPDSSERVHCQSESGAGQTPGA